ncbi:GLPGLI family protein [Ekhidna sp.]|uniref:GLPGLI family protein n=1 Tax=Ekhidna sp. TaxID=2608089 RepID=UPI0032EAA9D1
MKFIFILSLSIVCVTSVVAQNSGVITYEQVVKINTDRFPEEVRKMIPPERKSSNQLIFNEKEAIYKSIKNQEDINQEVTAGNDRMRFRMRGANDNEYYTNLSDNSSINKMEFFGRDFLVEGGENQLEWKVSSEMKMVGKYQAIKATSMRDTIPVIAWFTPQIPVSLGPGNYRGLPGMILHLDVNDGQETITATNLDIRALTDEETIVVPDKGKRVTREEFEKIREEKMEEMREMGGGRGNRVIIRN